MAEERQSAENRSRWWGEHLFRYQWAQEYVGASTKVLDVACGTGFGAAHLSGRGRATVIGGDLDAPSLADAAAEFGAPVGPHFVVMDGTRLPFPDRSLDVVVSFETVEHIGRYRAFVAELARVLHKTGVLLMSTPNRRITSPDGVIHNPYHTQEFDAHEVEELLRGHFARVSVMGQHYGRFDDLGRLRARVARAVEALLYARGVRKLPMAWRDGVARLLVGRPHYPLASDFRTVAEPAQIERSPTLLVMASGSLD